MLNQLWVFDRVLIVWVGLFHFLVAVTSYLAESSTLSAFLGLVPIAIGRGGER